jgi:23S rRNA (adenine2503-C2)-methyltransferase
LDPVNGRLNLYGLDRAALAEALAPYAAPRFHAEQVYRWMYARGVVESGDWTDLPRALRTRLREETACLRGTVAGRAAAADGTVKYRIEPPGGGAVEAVFMVQRGRTTLCLSSQVGCALDCDFCLTAKMGFVRHLSPGEILGQVALIREDRGGDLSPFNVVFMGMGEPLHNYDGVLAAIRILADPAGFGLSWRRITVSTSGLAPQIERLAGEPVRPRLAVSLNATDDETRDRLMPVNRRYPLRRLEEACRLFHRKTGDRFTFEYVLLEGVNDSAADVRRLAALLRRNPAAKLNLIPFNPVAGWLPYRPPGRDRIVAFRDRLLSQGSPVSIRWSRGAEARAACGQLALLPDRPGALSGQEART